MGTYQQLAQSIRSVPDLLQWSDRPFVELAFLLMLQRPADPEGVRYYLKRLREGHARIAILDQMGKSIEADPRWNQVKDLRLALERYRLSRRRVMGAWLRLTDPELATSRVAKRARVLDNALGRIRQDMLEAREEMQAEQERLRDLLGLLLSRPHASAGDLGVLDGRGQLYGSAGVAPHDPRLRSLYEVRETDLPASGRRVMATLRV